MRSVAVLYTDSPNADFRRSFQLDKESEFHTEQACRRSVVRTRNPDGANLKKHGASVQHRRPLCTRYMPRSQHAQNSRKGKTGSHTRHANAKLFRLRLTLFIESTAQSPTLSGQMCAQARSSTRHFVRQAPFSSMALGSAQAPSRKFSTGCTEKVPTGARFEKGGQNRKTEWASLNFTVPHAGTACGLSRSKHDIQGCYSALLCTIKVATALYCVLFCGFTVLFLLVIVVRTL